MATTPGVHEAARIGLGTYKSAAANLASSSLETILGAVAWAVVTDTVRHLTVYVVSGTLYVENDGTAADANCLPVGAGGSVSYPNSYAEITNLRFFADAAYDARFVLEG